MILYQVVMQVYTDNPQGLREALAMTGEQFGRVKAARVDPMEEQARIGDSGAAAAARAQLEAAVEGRKV